MASSQLYLSFIDGLVQRLGEKSPLIQVVYGPRQVGKTTGVLQIKERISVGFHYATADDVLSPDEAWILEQWQKARVLGDDVVLALDEIQKVPEWSSVVKRLFDRQSREKKSKIKIIVLGSSALLLSKGLSESLAGRYELTYVPHWGFHDSRKLLPSLSLDDYLKFGGYPGSYAYLKDPQRWKKYVTEAIIEAVITRDILSFVNVRSPALFRQAFEILCAYPAQEISYNKLLGQLQSKGNVELVKHYLTLYGQAFLVETLEKFSSKTHLRKASSPKILPRCPALTTAVTDFEFNDETRGRLFELAVGQELLRLGVPVTYWREGNSEVDYIVKMNQKIFAIEVKSGRKRKMIGLEAFLRHHKKSVPIFITSENFPKLSESGSDFFERLG